MVKIVFFLKKKKKNYCGIRDLYSLTNVSMLSISVYSGFFRGYLESLRNLVDF